ncbi:formate hydrogenlyase subunit 4 [Candidatus Moduliflexus flocculans]|uniref:Formate hydrogenlyase subunit 4 n=1 Tax=Candidatus Moduliflexus flocculans TaxID=1499966 RepID=A0A0S6W0K7_9BACT|nr:formate hydrogenlyase subunit 4 [Candidatus Moduliflexus flocculans]
MMTSFLFIIVNTAFVLAVSPLFISLIKKVKAFCQRRQGPPLLQTYYNLAKLLKKETVYSSNSSFIMRITPYLNMSVVLTASLAVPFLFIPRSMAGVGNELLFLYLLAFAKFFMALGGLDAGSTFGGMGSSREMALSAIFEPTVIIVFAALAYVLKTLDLHQMFAQSGSNLLMLEHPSLFLSGLSLFIILIVETARIPMDNPETHLELTMVHEAMILEQSGKNLALMEWSHAVKQTLLMAVLLNVLLPSGLGFSLLSIPAAALIFLFKGVALSVVVGVFESMMAKYRLFRLPGLFMVALFFSFLTIIVEVFL